MRAIQRTKAFDSWLIKTCWLQRNECYYCDEAISYPDRESYHIEHRIPIYWGGKSEYPNLCLACPSCNRTKATDQLIRNKNYLNRMNESKRTKVIYL